VSLVRGRMEGNPWLLIPADDYEAHMGAVGQSAVLRVLFADAYAERRPRRLAVLGCTTGADLEQIDPGVTEVVVGLDLNPDYLEIARRRLGALGSRLNLVCGDVSEAELPGGPFDLVHAALLLEYVEPAAFFRRIERWLAPDGICSLVTQEPAPGVPSVSATKYDSLQRLAACMTLRDADEVMRFAGEAGLQPLRRQTVTLPTGKRLVSSIFEKDGEK
jgi:SAM-dependent methyltransferase